MKKISGFFFAILWITCVTVSSTGQNIFPPAGSAGIGTTNPAVSALLEMESVSQGMLVPRMTRLQRDNISFPATGLLIYQTNHTPGFYYYNGFVWTAVSNSAGANKALSNLSATSINQSLVPDANNTKDLGSNSLNWRNLYLSGKINQGSATILELTANSSAIGFSALSSNTTGINNTAAGAHALASNTTGYQNTAVGDSCIVSNTTGYLLTAIGFGALKNNTTGKRNAAFGNGVMAHNTTGKSNAATGTHAMFNNTTGDGNTAVGTFALEENTVGNNNVAVGKSAMVNCISGEGNVGIGFHALYSNTAGSSLVAVGDSALAFNEGGTGQNTAVGGRAAFNNTVGSGNCYFGYGSGNANTTGNQLTLLGSFSDAGSSALSNSSAIGNGAVVTTSNSMRFGNNNVTFWGFGANASNGKALIVGSTASNGNGAYCTNGGTWTNASSRELKENFSSPDKDDVLNRINQLAIDKWSYKGSENEYHIGPMAEDFFAAFRVGIDDESISTIDPAGIALIGIQALSLQNVELRMKNEELTGQLDAVLIRLEAMEQSLNQCCEKYQKADLNSSANEPRLAQNIPNPFNQTTLIKFYIPSLSKNIQLLISDLAGVVLKKYSINDSGSHELMLDLNEFTSGSYNYSLFIDGKMIATKKLELLK
ncbi:MAG: tail fiber domain-containing protein [Chitinophagales bacterium]